MPSATTTSAAGGSRAATRRPRSATRPGGADASGLVEVLGPHLAAIAHLLLVVQILLHRRIVLHRPPGIVRALLPLIGLRVLIDIPGPITENIICRSRPPAIDRTTRPPSGDTRSGKGSLSKTMVVTRDHARPSCIDIRMIVVDKDIPVAGKPGAIEPRRTIPVPGKCRMIC